ncbi:protein kinase domain-containing protein [Bacillus sp. N6]|uniref:protein kinase domain-containing protein n=1 Tax=Bacillus sp. N6 TaxID=127893 RepID=UPI0040560C8C
MIDNNKKVIRSFLKTEGKLETPMGDINVKGEIGEGGNAIVFTADFGKNEVAIKILAEEVGQNSTKYRRFLTEFKEIVQLAETRAVVPIYYYGHLTIEGKQFPYILMKKYPYTLKSWLNTVEINNFDTLRPILYNLFKIVSVIHKKNIVHRDLKPENILVATDGKMVLADFGISWFDPEFYERHAQTKKGDRMANFDFSAPEQFQKANTPHCTMDIFALGQIITWIIIGSATRGDRAPLTAEDLSYEVIEPIVKKMLSNSPKERFQTIEEIERALIEGLQEPDCVEDEIDRLNNNLSVFDKLLRLSFPGKNGLVEAGNQKRIDFVMNQLIDVRDNINLWWTQGFSSSQIHSNLFKLDDETWIMDGIEIQIDKLWALKYPGSLDKQCLLIKTKPMLRFGIYEEREDDTMEEAAWFRDRYITDAEYDDGVADIDEESVLLEGAAEHRIRNLIPQYYFIGTEYHPIISLVNEPEVFRIHQKLLEYGELKEEDINTLFRLKKRRILRF